MFGLLLLRLQVYWGTCSASLPALSRSHSRATVRVAHILTSATQDLSFGHSSHMMQTVSRVLFRFASSFLGLCIYAHLYHHRILISGHISSLSLGCNSGREQLMNGEARCQTSAIHLFRRHRCCNPQPRFLLFLDTQENSMARQSRVRRFLSFDIRPIHRVRQYQYHLHYSLSAEVMQSMGVPEISSHLFVGP